MLQLTIMKITDYGPYTLTLGSDREHILQMLQASLYEKAQKFFSEKDGLVFPNRADEFFAVTNGISLIQHIEIQKKLESSFKIKFSACSISRFELYIFLLLSIKISAAAI